MSLRYAGRQVDLVKVCADCGITLFELASRTHLSEDELLSFAAGRIPLSATIRFAIFAILAEQPYEPPPGPPYDPCPLDTIIREVDTGWRRTVAFRSLIDEVDEERRVEHLERNKHFRLM
jgi:hypothetical protein